MSIPEEGALVHELREHDPTRPHSFDLTLELERQLEAESLPTSPARHEGRPQSLDTHVLASLVTSLRINVAELTKERDELSAALNVACGREADLASEVRQLKEAQAESDSELATLRQKAREDEESIVLLRSKVEESRRGVMRLQTENRRISRGADMSIDLSRASSFSFGGPPSAKRMSFTPLTGSSAGRMPNHRRISSVSDSNVSWSEVANGQMADTSPNPQIVTLPDGSPPLSHPPSSTRRFSGLFARASAPESEPVPGLNAAERENSQREIQTLKLALEEARHELAEANEAREASEICVKTLRDFITENNVGVSPVRPDIGSPMLRSDDTDKRNPNGGSRWGFGGLFRAGETSSPVISSRGASTSTSPSPTSEPLSRKLGGLFGSRGSFSSSSTSAPSRGAPIVQEAMYNGSDTSSTTESAAEPASPQMEVSPVQITRVLSETSSTSSELLAPRTVVEEKNGAAGLVVV
ncbi:hypothetical protein BC827DRAFT_1335957 [Russula dissimulans]|nr:hypothetical protein BC827DRAFT_1335957 [Russula dissimulans]